MQSFSVDKSSPIPYYYQIEEWLRDLIVSGQLKPGDPLETEISLGERLGVSRMTVRQALNHLTQEGILVRQRGKGSFVAPARSQVLFTWDHVSSMTEQVAEEGHILRSRVHAQELIEATGELQHELGLSPGEKVILVRRLRSVDGVPIVIESACHPYRRFPDLLAEDLTDRSIYEILEQQYCARPVEASDTFVAGLATKEEAALLQIKPGAPVMRFKRLARDASDQPVEYTTAVYRADRYQFVIRYRTPLQFDYHR